LGNPPLVLIFWFIIANEKAVTVGLFEALQPPRRDETSLAASIS
jgi:hypothetical protein